VRRLDGCIPRNRLENESDTPKIKKRRRQLSLPADEDIGGRLASATTPGLSTLYGQQRPLANTLPKLSANFIDTITVGNPRAQVKSCYPSLLAYFDTWMKESDSTRSVMSILS
jgi:hypothetical protein